MRGVLELVQCVLLGPDLSLFLSLLGSYALMIGTLASIRNY